MTYGVQDDVYGRLDGTKPVKVQLPRDPYIPEGKHRLVVVSLDQYNSQDNGPTVKATFEVVKSDTAPAGMRCCSIWFIVKQEDKAWKTTGADRFADFVRRIKGSPEGHPVGRDCATLLRDRAADQLTRGMLIDALGVNVSKKADKPFVNVAWTFVPQTAEEIRARRTQLDMVPTVTAAPAPAPAPIQYNTVTPATAAVPQGGFLAQLPPANNGGGSTGGSGGVGW